MRRVIGDSNDSFESVQPGFLVIVAIGLQCVGVRGHCGVGTGDLELVLATYTGRRGRGG